jgi:hypothetical protein
VVLLACGVLSSLLYLGIDALAALHFPDYHSYTAQAISELGAVFMTYNVLLLAFALGVWASAGRKRALRFIGALLAGIVAVGLVTPPMYLRGTGHVSGDLPHIVLTGFIVVFILSAVALGTSLYERRWRLYSWATLLVLLVSGAWTGHEAQHLADSLPIGSVLRNESTSAHTCSGWRCWPPFSCAGIRVFAMMKMLPELSAGQEPGSVYR